MPRSTTVTVTTKRLVWASRAFDKGNRYGGFGAIGLTVALTSTIVSKRRAARRSEGTALVGQLRFEWIDEVHVFRIDTSHLNETNRTRFGGPRNNLRITFPYQDGTLWLSFSSIDVNQLRLYEAWGIWLAQVIARHRLTTAGLSDADRAALCVTAKKPSDQYAVPPGGLELTLPGARVPR